MMFKSIHNCELLDGNKWIVYLQGDTAIANAVSSDLTSCDFTHLYKAEHYFNESQAIVLCTLQWSECENDGV